MGGGRSAVRRRGLGVTDKANRPAPATAEAAGVQPTGKQPAAALTRHSSQAENSGLEAKARGSDVVQEHAEGPPLAPVVHSLWHSSPGSALLLEVDHACVSQTLMARDVLRLPVRTSVIKRLDIDSYAALSVGTDDATAMPHTPPCSASAGCLAAAILAVTVPSLNEPDFVLPLLTLQTPGPAPVSGTPRSATISESSLLLSLVSVDAASRSKAEDGATATALPSSAESTAIFTFQLNTAKPGEPASLLPLVPSTTVQQGAAACRHGGTKLLSLPETVLPEVSASVAAQQTSAGRHEEREEVVSSMQDSGAWEGQAGGDVHPATYPATLMFTTTPWSRLLWRSAFLAGLQAENHALAHSRASLLTGPSPHPPIAVDPNDPMLEVLMFDTPVLPAHIVAGAARWTELVLANPALHTAAMQQGVLRPGLWHAIDAMGQQVLIQAPLPLSFSCAGPPLISLFIACIWQEANLAETPYMTYTIRADGRPDLEGKFSLQDLAGWLSAALGGTVELTEAAQAAAASM